MSEKSLSYSAVDAVKTIKSGEITSEALVESCLRRIDLRESSVQAWECIDRDLALRQARDQDRQEKTGTLQGVPIGIKDIVDTDDLPTAYGSPIYSGHQPKVNAECIKRLKAAGAVIMGKTVTTEFAFLHPGKTRNPHNVEHTPGGSSSGSAAAVADKHVPLALGTQTAGSIVRPASFCGVVGYKPTYNSFSFEGIHPFAPSFDTLGGFARSVEDIVLLRSVLGDDDSSIESQRPDNIGIMQGPYWENAESTTRALFAQISHLLSKAGIKTNLVELPRVFNEINEAHRKVMFGECVQTLGSLYLNHKEQFSEELIKDYEFGLTLSKSEIEDARMLINKCREESTLVFSNYDLILTPASPGKAPKGLGSTGDSVFNKMWTAMGLPCLSLPFPQKENELPLGVQLVGAFGGDRKLLSSALWFEELLKR
ncbi:MAG: Asp-tRNA(Asn)/Glu-tRNA(Gln) amidotransferase A subunit family amidase [Gammaproteobacteria bacterium]|jgi:Asp-tRNA(Asn)/Glu-tRNA(Gln) amidotransferase A subunit family amidase